MTRFTRTFVFHHHEPLGPFSLEELAAGQARFGGSVARLRLLFAIARRGHRVWLVGNVRTGSHLGVQAIETADLSTLSPPEGADTLIFNNPPPEEVWRAYSAARWPGAHHVVWAGNHFPQMWIDRLARREVDRIVCVSRSHRDDYRMYRGFERLEVSYSGIDKDFLLPRGTPEPNTAFFVSVPRRTKGFDSLLHAWRIVRASFPEARLLVSGASAMHDPSAPLGKTGILDADLEAEFSDFFGDYPTSSRAHGIELLGRRSLPEVYETLSRCSFAIVNPGFSSPETYCRAAVEAQAAGAAVVGARSGSLPEVVADGRTGLLARDSRPDSLAEIMLRLFRSPELAADMGRHGIAWSNWLADYDLIAPDWEFIAERAETDAPAPAQPWPTEDKLRALGLGAARAWVRAAVPEPMLEVVRSVRRLARA